MRLSHILTLILLVWAGFSTTSLQAQSKEELQEMYTDFLDREGYNSWVDEDGDIQFKREGKTFFIEVDEDDAEFFRVVLPNIWPIESEEEREQVLYACDVANRRVKTAKIYTVRDNVWISVEVFEKDRDDYESYFDRCIKVVSLAADYFVEAMNE